MCFKVTKLIYTVIAYKAQSLGMSLGDLTEREPKFIWKQQQNLQREGRMGITINSDATGRPYSKQYSKRTMLGFY